MHESVLKPIRDKWPQILGIIESRDTEKWGFIHQTEFMRVIRLAGGCKDMSDSEFMNTVCFQKDLRDTRGFINYVKFHNDILNF